MASAQEQITEIAKDLLSLEINTILSPAITAAKMPPPYVTLRDVAFWYIRELQIDEEQKKALRNEIIDAVDESDLSQKNKKFKDTYVKIKAVAKSMIERSPDDETIEMQCLRIIDASGKIAKIMDELNGGSEFTSDHIVKIRKIWELGLDVVIMQTGVQLDGDVFVRIHPKYATPEYQTLFKIHHDSVDIAVSFWQELVGIVIDFFQKIIKPFFSTP